MGICFWEEGLQGFQISIVHLPGYGSWKVLARPSFFNEAIENQESHHVPYVFHLSVATRTELMFNITNQQVTDPPA